MWCQMRQTVNPEPSDVCLSIEADDAYVPTPGSAVM